MLEYSHQLSTAITKGEELANSTVISMNEINEQTIAIENTSFAQKILY